MHEQLMARLALDQALRVVHPRIVAAHVTPTDQPQLAVARRLRLLLGKLDVIASQFAAKPIVQALEATRLVAKPLRPLRLQRPEIRSEARREGKECISTCRIRWSPEQ